MFLLDTNVLSEGRKRAAGNGHPSVIAWLDSLPREAAFLSAISVYEIQSGISALETREPDRSAILQRWLDINILDGFAGRILPVDGEVAALAARMMHPKTRPFRDTLIAATAIRAGFTIATRNVRDFADMNVRIFNPWGA